VSGGSGDAAPERRDELTELLTTVADAYRDVLADVGVSPELIRTIIPTATARARGALLGQDEPVPRWQLRPTYYPGIEYLA